MGDVWSEYPAGWRGKDEGKRLRCISREDRMVVMEEETQEYCGREGMMKGREGGVHKKSCEGTNNAVGVR